MSRSEPEILNFSFPDHSLINEVTIPIFSADSDQPLGSGLLGPEFFRKTHSVSFYEIQKEQTRNSGTSRVSISCCAVF